MRYSDQSFCVKQQEQSGKYRQASTCSKSLNFSGVAACHDNHSSNEYKIQRKG